MASTGTLDVEVILASGLRDGLWPTDQASWEALWKIRRRQALNAFRKAYGERTSLPIHPLSDALKCPSPLVRKRLLVLTLWWIVVDAVGLSIGQKDRRLILLELTAVLSSKNDEVLVGVAGVI